MWILGAAFLTAGGLLGFLQWRITRQNRLEILRQQIRFLSYAKYRIGIEKAPIIRILKEFDAGQDAFVSFADQLQKCQYANGKEGWSLYWKTKKEALFWDKQRVYWLEAALGLFGRNAKENEEILLSCKVQLEKLYEQEKDEFQRRQKAMASVSMAAAFLLILLLS